MASSINASTSGAGGVITTADNTGILNLQTASTNAVTIDASQNVGIGTTSPTQKLDVASKVTVTTSNAYGKINIARATDSGLSALYIQGADNAGTANELSLVNAGGGGAAINITGGDLRFYASSNTTERMRIDSNGDIEIGKTDGSQNTQGILLNTYGTGRFTATAQQAMHMNRLTSDGQIVAFYRSSSQVGNISVTTSATTYNSGSDYRLKENILPMTNALDKVSLLKPVTFKWKIDGSDGQGFIAHELAEVIPDAVTGIKDAIDAEGNPDYQSVDPRMIVATLTAAIQEQQTIINDLKARVTALEAK